MNQRQSKYQSFDSSPVMTIPVKFEPDLPFCLPMKIQTPEPMKNSLLVPEKPLVPALIESPSFTGEPRPKSVNQTVLGEMMLDARRLEAVLKDVVRRKKAAVRRVAAGRFNKILSLNDGRRA